MNKLFYIVLFLISSSIFSQENTINDLSVEWDAIVKTVFYNLENRNEIHYIGAIYRGEGTFWIILNGERVDILKTEIRYGPIVKWHGLNIAEIFIPTGSPNSHSYFYDFRDNTLSHLINFPLYYDVVNDFIIVLREEGLDLYDMKNKDIKNKYYFEDTFDILDVIDVILYGNFNITIINKILYLKINVIDFNGELGFGLYLKEKEYIFDYY